MKFSSTQQLCQKINLCLPILTHVTKFATMVPKIAPHPLPPTPKNIFSGNKKILNLPNFIYLSTMKIIAYSQYLPHANPWVHKSLNNMVYCNSFLFLVFCYIIFLGLGKWAWVAL
jgi:hypothetical protein